MDLTASLENYAESDKVFRVFKYGQYINFETPVFTDSLVVYLISGGVTTTLVKGTDFVVPEDAIAQADNDMSSAKLMDSSFDKELTYGIQMIMGIDEGSSETISVSYQRLYPNQLRTAYYHNEPLSVTPELFYDVVKTVEQLKALNSRVTDASSLSADDSAPYEVDESCSNTNNEVTGEKHTVSVSTGKCVIHPKGGAFYLDSLAVRLASTGETLVKDTDYLVVGMDEPRTKATSYTSPVYQFVVITSNINADIEIDYHAFGGLPTIDNYRQIVGELENIVTYLNASTTLTESNLGSTEVMTSVYERISALESKMRRLEGTPSYGDVTNGKCILMKLFADGDTDLHWYTIASLYKTAGTSMTPCTADTFKFRLQSKTSHFQFEAAVSVDLSNEEGDRLNVNVVSENYPRGYVPFNDYTDVDAIIRPQLRIVWMEQDTISGAYLQLGFRLVNMLEETISIEDTSGHESCWILPDEVSTHTTPSDDNFMLPDGLTTWSSSLSNAQEEDMLIPFHKGHLIWAGTQPMNRPLAGWQHFDITDELLIDSSINIKKITCLRLDVEEQDGLQYPVDIKFNSGTEHLKGHASFTYQDLPAYVNAEIYKVDGTLHVRLNYDITAGVDANEFDLRDLVIYL